MASAIAPKLQLLNGISKPTDIMLARSNKDSKTKRQLRIVLLAETDSFYTETLPHFRLFSVHCHHYNYHNLI
jgi:hypothetical protein